VKYVNEYREVEARAKVQKKGIWADKPCEENGRSKSDDDRKDDGNKDSDCDKGSDNKGGTINSAQVRREQQRQSDGNTGSKSAENRRRLIRPFSALESWLLVSDLPTRGLTGLKGRLVPHPKRKKLGHHFPSTIIDTD